MSEQALRPGEISRVTSLQDVPSMARQNIIPGTCVQLRSGGPTMTVQDLVSKQTLAVMESPVFDYAVCYWFDLEQTLQEATFCLAGLVVT